MDEAAGHQGLRVRRLWHAVRRAGPDAQAGRRKSAPHAEEISKLWRQKQLEYTWLRSLMGVHADFWHVTGDALDYALDQFGVSEPGLGTRSWRST